MADFDAKLLSDYEAGGDLLRQAVAGLNADDLLARPVAGTWSIQEIVIHLQDSDLIGIDRMKRIIAEDNPLLLGYNETKFVQHLRSDLQRVEDAMTLFDLARRQFARVLRALPAEAFARTGVHNEVGLVTLGQQVGKYQAHLLHHLKFVKDKRERLGKPLAG